MRIRYWSSDVCSSDLGVEFVGAYADRLARGATRAARAIRDRLAAAEPDPAERVVQFGGVRAGKLGEHLPFLPPRQIGAGRWAGYEEPRKSEWSGHRCVLWPATKAFASAPV